MSQASKHRPLVQPFVSEGVNFWIKVYSRNLRDFYHLFLTCSYGMDITPLTNLVKTDIVYNSNLCLICQRNPKEKLTRKTLESVLKTILDGKKNADQLGNLSHDSPDTLLEKRYSYHKRCRSVQDLKWKRLENCAQSDSAEELVNTSPQKRRLTRSMLPQFNINVCIVCQEETNKKTQSIIRSSRSTKQAGFSHSSSHTCSS